MVMDGTLHVTTMLPLLVPLVLYFMLQHYLRFTYDPMEPPVVPQKFPFVGHIFGLIRHRLRYFELISAKHPLPIYTLEMLNRKTYVVNTPDLVMAVQRNTKTLSFVPLEAVITERLVRASKRSMAIVWENLYGEQGDWGLIVEVNKATHAAMTPGPDLSRMSYASTRKFFEALDGLDGSEAGQVMDLYTWVRHTMTMAGTEAMYGPQNPFTAHPGLEDSFWAFERATTKLLVDIAPSVFAPKGVNGREKLFEALDEYIQKNGHESGSGVIKARCRISKKYGLSREEISRFEVASTIGLLVNTSPTTFWTMFHIFSNPALLDEIRQEIDSAASPTGPVECKISRRLDVTQIKETCPLLYSTFQEVLRVGSFSASARVVMKDTLINDQYLLKKDSIVQMPSAVIHADSVVWGPNAAGFDPRRFLKRDARKGDQKQHPGAFRTFGGGVSLCPGRHFATASILSIVAMFAMRYDMVSLSGNWVAPEPDVSSIVPGILPPRTDIKVRITKRKDFEPSHWIFHAGDSMSSSAISA